MDKTPIDHSLTITPEQLDRARRLIVSTQFASTSMVQRKLSFGLLKSMKIMDLLEAEGTVGPEREPHARNVLTPPPPGF